MVKEPLPTDEESFLRFKWSILADSVWEDYQGVWEPLWALRGDYAIEGLVEEADRHAVAERALRELYEEGLIYFFRVPDLDINAAGEEESLRLNRTEVEESLAGDWWRGRELAPDVTTIWWGPTARGEKACEDPPPEIRGIWESPYP